ncbi:MAG TPA: hypothetical protein VLI05_05130 [Candidatus Saccharimonadia bacterium]|nr:hypothetical protein [Candidatus Saccharimonadia bacterium]
MLARSLASLTALAVLLAACSSSGAANTTTRLLDPQEQDVINEQATIGNGSHTFSSLIEALESGGNTYQPIQITEAPEDKAINLQSGVVLFAVCAKGQTLQECANDKGTPTTPLVYLSEDKSIDISNGRTDLTLSGPVAYLAKVADGSELNCKATGGFQLNPESLRQLHLVFEAFTRNGKAISGDMPVDFGATTADPHFPAQNRLPWHCDVNAPVPAPIS